MSQKTPIVLSDNRAQHTPLSKDDTISVDSIPLSPDAGNQIQGRENGLYYGVEAPKDVRNLYISTSLGNDTNDGTRDHPLKTLAGAVSRYTNNPFTYTIFLRCGEVFEHNEALGMSLANLEINPYDYPQEEAYLSGQCAYYAPQCDINFPCPVIEVGVHQNNQTPPIDYQYNGFYFANVSMMAIDVRLKPIVLNEGDTFNPWGIFTGNSVHFQWGHADATNTTHKPRWFEAPTVTLVCGKYDIGEADGTNGWLVTSDHGSVVGYNGYVGTPAGCPEVGANAYTPKPSTWQETVGKLTPENLCYDSRFDKSTKRYFSAIPTWDIFANE